MRPKPLIRPSTVKAAIFVAALATAGAAAGQGPTPERQGELLHLLRQDCGSCHGMTMKGGLGPGLLPANLKDKPDDTLVDIILDGVPQTPMPAWRPLLAPGEAAWIVTQLKKGLQ